jgi:hypothetical protein
MMRMMLTNHVMSELKPTPAQALAVMPQPPARKLVAPPALQLLPRGAYKRGMFFSSVLHTALLSAATWLPSFFPHAVVIEPRAPDQSELASSEQLIFPALPKLNIAGADAESPAAEQRTSLPTRTTNQPQLKRDYAGSQEIVSLFPDAVNRVQTIRRPDLPSPPGFEISHPPAKYGPSSSSRHSGACAATTRACTSKAPFAS